MIDRGLFENVQFLVSIRGHVELSRGIRGSIYRGADEEWQRGGGRKGRGRARE